MDNKLSELSKPVGFVSKQAQALLKSGDTASVRPFFDVQGSSPLYSQEYVSALIQRTERLDSMLTESVQALKAVEQRNAELEAKLATPVRLPRPACTYADHSYPAYSRKQVEGILTSAGMCFTVEGDEQ
ncbi:TPA: hypothetical protein ACXJS2_001725 [Serratia marcescens]